MVTTRSPSSSTTARSPTPSPRWRTLPPHRCGWEECWQTYRTPHHSTSTPATPMIKTETGHPGNITCGFGQQGIGMLQHVVTRASRQITKLLKQNSTVRVMTSPPLLIATWVGALAGARDPAWMATPPWTTPNTPLQCQNTGNAAPLRQCGVRRSLVPRPRQRNAQAQQLQPCIRPRYVLGHFRPGGCNFLFSDSSILLSKPLSARGRINT